MSDLLRNCALPYLDSMEKPSSIAKAFQTSRPRVRVEYAIMLQNRAKDSKPNFPGFKRDSSSAAHLNLFHAGKDLRQVLSGESEAGLAAAARLEKYMKGPKSTVRYLGFEALAD